MLTPIGRRLEDSRLRVAASTLVAAFVTLADFWLVGRGDDSYDGPRALLPVAGLAAYLVLARSDLPSVGLRLRPSQGLLYWIKATLVIGAAIGSFILVAIAVLHLVGRDFPVYRLDPADAWPTFVRMCVVAPLAEEATYRLGLCTGAVGSLKPWGTIAASGIAFGALHVLYGNPGTDNLIAGFFLAWAYLKSGSILVPIALHSLGNLCVLALWVAAWYWAG